MSRLFEASYHSLLLNLLQNEIKSKPSRKSSGSKKLSTKSKPNITVPESTGKINDQKVINYNIFQTVFKEPEFYVNDDNSIKSKKLFTSQRKFIFYTDQDFETSPKKLSSNKADRKFEEKMSKRMKDNQNKEQEQNTFPFSRRKEKNLSKQKKSHEQLQESLIKSAANQKESQRLQVIFESARKPNKPQKQFLTQSQNKKSNSILNSFNVDEVSRTVLRRSFCLQMIADDKEWDRVVSNSKSKKRWTGYENDEK